MHRHFWSGWCPHQLIDTAPCPGLETVQKPNPKRMHNANVLKVGCYRHFGTAAHWNASSIGGPVGQRRNSLDLCAFAGESYVVHGAVFFRFEDLISIGSRNNLSRMLSPLWNWLSLALREWLIHWWSTRAASQFLACSRFCRRIVCSPWRTPLQVGRVDIHCQP